MDGSQQRRSAAECGAAAGSSDSVDQSSGADSTLCHLHSRCDALRWIALCWIGMKQRRLRSRSKQRADEQQRTAIVGRQRRDRSAERSADANAVCRSSIDLRVSVPSRVQVMEGRRRRQRPPCNGPQPRSDPPATDDESRCTDRSSTVNAEPQRRCVPVASLAIARCVSVSVPSCSFARPWRRQWQQQQRQRRRQQRPADGRCDGDDEASSKEQSNEAAVGMGRAGGGCRVDSGLGEAKRKEKKEEKHKQKKKKKRVSPAGAVAARPAALWCRICLAIAWEQISHRLARQLPPLAPLNRTARGDRRHRRRSAWPSHRAVQWPAAAAIGRCISARTWLRGAVACSGWYLAARSGCRLDERRPRSAAHPASAPLLLLLPLHSVQSLSLLSNPTRSLPFLHPLSSSSSSSSRPCRRRAARAPAPLPLRRLTPPLRSRSHWPLRVAPNRTAATVTTSLQRNRQRQVRIDVVRDSMISHSVCSTSISARRPAAGRCSASA